MGSSSRTYTVYTYTCLIHTHLTLAPVAFCVWLRSTSSISKPDLSVFLRGEMDFLTKHRIWRCEGILLPCQTWRGKKPKNILSQAQKALHSFWNVSLVKLKQSSFFCPVWCQAYATHGSDSVEIQRSVGQPSWSQRRVVGSLVEPPKASSFGGTARVVWQWPWPRGAPWGSGVPKSSSQSNPTLNGYI